MNVQAFFFRQFTTYASYHRHPKNRATHFVGIPCIVLALLCVIALWTPRLFGLSIPGVWIVAGLALAGWIVLDRRLGLAMAIMIVPMAWFAGWIAGNGGPVAAWAVAAILFVFGWIFQIVGHLWEGRRPALVDNLFQAFIGPMFIVAEIAILLGYRADLRSASELVGVRHSA